MRQIFAATCISSFALAAPACFAQSTEPAPLPPASSSTAPAIHGYGDRDKTCLAWTDQCRSCQRAADDQIHCNNIGIACQPVEIACTERKPDTKPETKPEPPK